MVRTEILFFICAVIVLTEGVKPLKYLITCHKLFNLNAGKCCNMTSLQEVIKVRKPIIAECSVIPQTPEGDRLKCLVNKLGYVSSDAKEVVDKDKITAIIERDFKENPEVISAIKDKCINGDFSIYGRPADIALSKFEMCLKMQMFAKCPSWHGGPCDEIKDAAANCLKLFQ